MLRTLLAVSPLLIAATGTLTAATQERVKKKQAKDFPALLETANTSWAAGSFGAASEALADAQKLVIGKRREAILAAFPPAPDQWVFTPSEVDEGAMMLFGAGGLGVEGNYRGPEPKRLTITATVDSPMIQMMSMMFQNPAMLGDDAELIKYGPHQAILKKNGDKRYELQILIGNDFVSVESRGVSDDELLGMMNQAAVDRLQAAMAN